LAAEKLLGAPKKGTKNKENAASSGNEAAFRGSFQVLRPIFPGTGK
jgi:hypothetical protein